MEKILNNNDNLSQKICIKKKQKHVGVREVNFFFFAEKSLNPSCPSLLSTLSTETYTQVSSLALHSPSTHKDAAAAAIRGRNPATKAEERVYTVLITLRLKISHMKSCPCGHGAERARLVSSL